MNNAVAKHKYIWYIIIYTNESYVQSRNWLIHGACSFEKIKDWCPNYDCGSYSVYIRGGCGSGPGCVDGIRTLFLKKLGFRSDFWNVWTQLRFFWKDRIRIGFSSGFLIYLMKLLQEFDLYIVKICLQWQEFLYIQYMLKMIFLAPKLPFLQLVRQS